MQVVVVENDHFKPGFVTKDHPPRDALTKEIDELLTKQGFIRVEEIKLDLIYVKFGLLELGAA